MTRPAVELQWYFDFISPFAYLQAQQIHRLPADIALTYVPVLFGGLLNHWKQLGPAEIPHKRVYTFRYVQWLARTHGIDYRTPPVHPFHPLPSLRLCIALGSTPETVQTIFRAIWVDGARTDTPDGFEALAARLGSKHTAESIGAVDIKDQLRRNTDGAIEHGVFGVPTFRFGEHLFWGFDSFDFLLDSLDDPALLDREEMRRIATLPIGIERKR